MDPHLRTTTVIRSLPTFRPTVLTRSIMPRNLSLLSRCPLHLSIRIMATSIPFHTAAIKRLVMTLTAPCIPPPASSTEMVGIPGAILTWPAMTSRTRSMDRHPSQRIPAIIHKPTTFTRASGLITQECVGGPSFSKACLTEPAIGM